MKKYLLFMAVVLVAAPLPDPDSNVLLQERPRRKGVSPSYHQHGDNSGKENDDDEGNDPHPRRV